MSVCNDLYKEIPQEIRSWGENQLEPNNVYRIVGEQLFSFIPEDELISMYSKTGRPSINPVILSLVTIFQYLENVPDRVAALWVKMRLDWKYALHLSIDDPGFHYSDLSNFRERLSSHGKESLIFDQLLKKIESLGFLKKYKQQRTDSTHVLAAIRQLSRLENLNEGLRVALKAIEKADSDFYKDRIPTVYRENYSTHKSDYQMTDTQRHEALNRLGQDINWLICFLETNKKSFIKLPELEILQTLFSQHFTIQHKEIHKEIHLKEDTTDCKEKIQTPHDYQARYSTKRNKSWIGYKVHITETANEKGEVNYITDIATTNACERDNETLPEIQKNLDNRGFKPEEQFVDKGYVTGDSLSESSENGIQLMGEASQLDNNVYTPDDFIIDYEAQTATCPAGNTSISFKELESGKHKGEVQIFFGQQCQNCEHKEKCTTSKKGRKLRLHRHYDLLKKRREEGKTSDFKQAMKRRPPVEGTISDLVRSCGLRRSRYLGILKTHLQNLLKGAALNLKRLIKSIGLCNNGEKHKLVTV